MSLKIFGVKGIGLMKLNHVMCRWMGVLIRVENSGGHWPLKIWEDKKRPKFGAI